METRDIKPDKDGVFAKCPHCEKKMREILRIIMRGGIFGLPKGLCYICPHCNKVLGFSQGGN